MKLSRRSLWYRWWKLLHYSEPYNLCRLFWGTVGLSALVLSVVGVFGWILFMLPLKGWIGLGIVVGGVLGMVALGASIARGIERFQDSVPAEFWRAHKEKVCPLIEVDKT